MKDLFKYILLVFVFFILWFLGICISGSFYHPHEVFSLLKSCIIEAYYYAKIGEWRDSYGYMERIILLRVIRLSSGAIVGASLALAGCALQRMLRNPLADPYILGISAGGAVSVLGCAALGAPFVFWGLPMTFIYSLIGCLFTLSIILGFKKILRTSNDEYIIPVLGMVLNSFFGTLIMFIGYLASDEVRHRSYAMMMGQIMDIEPSLFLLNAVVSLVFIFIILRFSVAVHVLTFGDDFAKSVGFNAPRMRTFLFVMISLLIAMCVSIAGSVGFVGLIIPHLARSLFGKRIKNEWMMAMFLGSVALMMAEIITKHIAPQENLPAGMITALIGAPLLAFLLIFNMKRKAL